jgi:plastocyanin
MTNPRVLAAPLVATLLLAACGTSTSNNNPDSGPGPTACTDQTGGTPRVTIITTGGAYGGYAFSPACVQINKGQSVTFTGDYSLHTVERTTQTVAAAANPLPSTPYSGASPVTFGPFPDSGDFNFYCSIHGFSGTVRVNP